MHERSKAMNGSNALVIDTGANAIFTGIAQYFDGNAPDGTRLAGLRRAGATELR